MELKVGIQMFSVRQAMARDPISTIRRVSELGYHYLELANLNAYKDYGCGFNVDASELAEAARDCGASIIGAHVYPLDKTNIERVLEYHARLGTKYIMSKSDQIGKDDLLRDAEKFNYLGELCRKYGIQHCYHTALLMNCDDGTELLDVITENTAPENLKLELDTYWTQRSGFDPIETIKKYNSRIALIHQKDLPEKTVSPMNVVAALNGQRLPFETFYDFINAKDFVEVGTGIMDLQGIIDATSEYTEAEYIILEQDFTVLDEFESISKSMEGFKCRSGISWN